MAFTLKELRDTSIGVIIVIILKLEKTGKGANGSAGSCFRRA